jgi:NitT/TauT family transport system ATP-binding protein
MCSTSATSTEHPGRGSSSRFRDHLNQVDAGKTLRAAIEWGRYAELFSFDDETRMFSLDHAGQ